MVKCCVCGYTNDKILGQWMKVILHKFPAKPDICQQWMQAINQENLIVNKNTRLCSLHFTEDCFRQSAFDFRKTRYLKKDAIPTKFGFDNYERELLAVKEAESTEVEELTEIETALDDNTNPPSTEGFVESFNNTAEDEICQHNNYVDNIPSTNSSAHTRNHNQNDAKLHLADHDYEFRLDDFSALGDISANNTTEDTIHSSANKELLVYSTPKKHQQERGQDSPKKGIKTIRYIGDATAEELKKSPWKIDPYVYRVNKSLAEKNAKIDAVTKKLKRMETKVHTLQELLNELKHGHYINENAQQVLETSCPPAVKELFNKLLSTNNNSTKAYPDDLKKFAATLHFYSPKAYEYVRSTFLKCLPHFDTIRRWSSNIDCSPGFLSHSLETLQIQIKVASSENKKLYFSLMVDEMAIKQRITFKNGQFYGSVDCGTHLQSPDQLPIAKDAIVFMVNCINGYFKLPVCYYFVNGVDGESRANMLTEVLTVLEKIGVDVRSVTADGTNCNITMFKNMGSILSRKVCKDTNNDTNENKIIKINQENDIMKNNKENTKKKSRRSFLDKRIEFTNVYFHHPANKNKKVYVMLDACHMIKLIRNALAALKIIYERHEDDSMQQKVDQTFDTIEWQYFKNIEQYQEEKQLHAACKIRKRHINFENQKMKVSLATQLLSRSAAIAMNHIYQTEQNDSSWKKRFEGFEATSKFADYFDQMFDLCNSRNLYCKSNRKSPIKRENLQEINENVEKYTEYILSLEAENGEIIDSSRKTGFTGMIITMNSLVHLAEDLFAENNDIKFLMTYKFSQDHLETFFSAFRRRFNCNDNPTAYQFVAAMRSLLSHVRTVLPSKGANCQPLDSTITLSTDIKSGKNIQQQTHFENEDKDDEDDDDNVDDNDDEDDEDDERNFNESETRKMKTKTRYNSSKNRAYVNYKEHFIADEFILDVLAYICGYIVRAFQKINCCQECKLNLTGNESPSLLQDLRDLGGLRNASEVLVNLITIAEVCFRNCDNIISIKDPLHHLINIAMDQIPPEIYEMFRMNHNKKPGRHHISEFINKILEKFFMMRINHETVKYAENMGIR